MQAISVEARQYDRTIIENAKRLLEEVKKRERRQMRHGYRWFKLNALHQILVPYGKDGKPTERGREMIEAYMQSQNIKCLEYDTI